MGVCVLNCRTLGKRRASRRPKRICGREDRPPRRRGHLSRGPSPRCARFGRTGGPLMFGKVASLFGSKPPPPAPQPGPQLAMPLFATAGPLAPAAVVGGALPEPTGSPCREARGRGSTRPVRNGWRLADGDPHPDARPEGRGRARREDVVDVAAARYRGAGACRPRDRHGGPRRRRCRRRLERREAVGRHAEGRGRRGALLGQRTAGARAPRRRAVLAVRGDASRPALGRHHDLGRQGPVLQHGQTFGPSAEEKWSIRHEPSKLVPGRDAIVLEMP